MGDPKKMLQVRSARQVPVRVMLLDDEIYNDSVDKRAVGWVLFERVCESLNILEKDYFGLSYIDPSGLKFWLNNDKKIAKQMHGMNWDFKFEVKFYPPDPSMLAEDLTRYQLCLQIRRDMVNEKLPCSFVTYTLLGSYTAQSELGDFDTEEFGHGTSYLKDIKFAPHQDRELLQKIAELHRQHKGQTPEEAEIHFLENAKKLAMFGVELHSARDAEGEKIKLGICASGIIVYKDKVQMNRFVWPKVLKLSYRRKKFYIKIRPGEFEEFASLIGFRLDSITLAKRLWKISVEHHSFFRFREADPPKKVGLFPRFGSRFRYSGRTQFQSKQAVQEEDREAPQFDRVLSKRGTFSARTNTQRQRDEDRAMRRDMRERRRERPPEPPEPTKAPPPAPKPKPLPRGPPSVEDDLSEKGKADSINDSFEDIPDRRSKIERIHGVQTPLSMVLQKSMEKERSDHEDHSEHEEDSNSHGPPGYSTDDPERREHRLRHDELDLPPIGSEEIDQHVASVDDHIEMTPKQKKLYEKQQKEIQKKERELEKQRKKEEEKERKRIEKERKALIAKEKKAAKSKGKQLGYREPDIRERRDSKTSNDIGRDWDEARHQENRGNVTPERTRKRLSSFEDIKTEVDRERPPTPPEPLPPKRRGSSGSENYDSADEADDRGRGRHDDHEAEEVSF